MTSVTSYICDKECFPTNSILSVVQDIPIHSMGIYRTNHEQKRVEMIKIKVKHSTVAAVKHFKRELLDSHDYRYEIKQGLTIDKDNA